MDFACFALFGNVDYYSSLQMVPSWKWTFVTLSESAPLEAHRLLFAREVLTWSPMSITKEQQQQYNLGPNLELTMYFKTSQWRATKEKFKGNFQLLHWPEPDDEKTYFGGWLPVAPFQFYSLTPCDQSFHAILWGQEFSIRIRCHLPSALSAAAAVVIKTPWLKNSDERSESYRSSSQCNMRNSLFFTTTTVITTKRAHFISIGE